MLTMALTGLTDLKLTNLLKTKMPCRLDWATGHFTLLSLVA